MTTLKKGWAWPLRARKAHFFVGGFSLCGRWAFGGQLSDSRVSHGEETCTACIRALSVKPQAQDSANDQSCAVPAIAPEGLRLPGLLCPQPSVQDVRLSPSPARRELRLLCLLVTPKLATAEARHLPVHTVHRLPPRAMVTGKWSNPRYAGLYLRETHAVEPSAEVLERCLRQRQAHPFRTPARTVRAGGVSA